MAGNLLDLDVTTRDLIGIRDEVDKIGQQLHDAAHHQDRPDDAENVRAAADEVMQAWAKLTVATANLDAVRSARVQRARQLATAHANLFDPSFRPTLGGLL